MKLKRASWSQQLDNSTTGENSFSDDSAEPDEPEQLGPGDVADCPSHDLTTVLARASTPRIFPSRGSHHQPYIWGRGQRAAEVHVCI